MEIKEAFRIKNSLSKDILYPRSAGKTMLKEEYSNFSGLGNIDNIIGVGVGFERRGINNSFVVNLYVENKEEYNTNFLTEKYDVLDGTQIRVNTIGKISLSPTRMHRPASPGCSVGHPNITACTIGCFVIGEEGIYILSNNHVLADNNRAAIGDIIIQPGTLDGGNVAYNAIARLEDFEPINFAGDNEMDAAIAKINGKNANPFIPHIGRIRGVREPSAGMIVEKFGRTTGYTRGIIQDIGADVLININGNRVRFIDQMRITSSIPGILFSSGGDSGSLILHRKNAVGLLFAGSDTTNTTFATPIIKILNRFNVNILSAWTLIV